MLADTAHRMVTTTVDWSYSPTFWLPLIFFTFLAVIIVAAIIGGVYAYTYETRVKERQAIREFEAKAGPVPPARAA